MNAIVDFHNCDLKPNEEEESGGLKLDKSLQDDLIIESEREAKDQEELKFIDDNLDSVDDAIDDQLKKIKNQKKKHEVEIEEEDDTIDVLQEQEDCLTDKLINEAKKKELDSEKGIAKAFKDSFLPDADAIKKDGDQRLD